MRFSGPAEVFIDVAEGIGLRVFVYAGCRGSDYPRRISNKDRVALRFIRNMNWRVKSVSADGDGEMRIELEAIGADENAVKALKALKMLNSLRDGEAERLEEMPFEEACKELVLMYFLDGTPRQVKGAQEVVSC